MPINAKSDQEMEVRALLLGERIEIRGFEPGSMVSQAPLAFHPSSGGLVCVFRFGAVVFFGVAASAQTETIAQLRDRVIDPAQPIETETAVLVGGAGEDAVIGSGKIALVDLSDERLLAVADALAKSVALADDERYVAKVFEQVEPLAQNLSSTGGVGLTSTSLLQLLGAALVAQARMVGRVEVEEKPDLLWDRPNLQRLYARLVDEYELTDRARALSRKLKVIEECAATLSDVTHTRRTHRLELAVVALIVVEVVLALFELAHPWN